LDINRTAWIEDESRNIGKVIIPGAIFESMSRAKVILIERPFGERVNRLLNEYGHFENRELSEIIIKISKRIGGDVAQAALKELELGDVRGAIEIILKYYDKTYAYGLSKRPEDNITRISIEDFKNLAFIKPAP
jgi:tRNA 2-selenouridine synthase